jgi:hypothetical protein
VLLGGRHADGNRLGSALLGAELALFAMFAAALVDASLSAPGLPNSASAPLTPAATTPAITTGINMGMARPRRVVRGGRAFTVGPAHRGPSAFQ